MDKLDILRESVRERVTPERFHHILGVETVIARLGEIYMPCKVYELRVAALLHDVTRNESIEKQLQYLEEFGIMKDSFYSLSPELLHGVTASLIIPRDFPEYSMPYIISAVRWHTTGRRDMTDFEALVYLADLIEQGRRHRELVLLREDFWRISPALMSETERQRHLYFAVIRSLDNTIEHLLEEGKYISPDSVECRNYYIEKSQCDFK